MATLLILQSCSWFGGDKEKSYNELAPLAKKVQIRERWHQSVGSGAGELHRIMAPVVTSDTVYANDYKGKVFAFDRETGERLWRKSLNLEVATGVGVAGGLVLVGSLDGDIVALSDQTGEERWRVNITSEVLSPPQSNGPVVVIQTNDGKLIGLNSKNGEVIWTYSIQLPILTLRGTATPQVLGPNIITGFANGKLVALSAVDGSPYWERRIARPQGRSDIERVVDIDGTPVIADGLIYATSYNGNLTALSPRGETRWSERSSSYSSPVVINGRVYVTTADGYIRAFDADNGQILWENTVLYGRKLTAPQSLAGFLVTADFEGYVHVIDPEAGLILDRFRVDSKGVRSPMVSDGTYLYVMGNDGKLVSITVYLLGD
ncbi:MAG: outer membrane protein assembly factor BamB [Cellvibrionaceae bacterium]|jgi:outer membrane protein assembly factor BamB